MLSYTDFTNHFGRSLFEKEFQSFLIGTFSDLSEYDITESDYIISDEKGLELGFTNAEAVYDEDDKIIFQKGNPIFSHFNIYPKASKLISDFPFGVQFTDKRFEVINKAGKPTETKEGFSDLLDKAFLVDNYKQGENVITFDYDVLLLAINFIQIRDNNLLEHLRL